MRRWHEGQMRFSSNPCRMASSVRLRSYSSGQGVVGPQQHVHQQARQRQHRHHQSGQHLRQHVAGAQADIAEGPTPPCRSTRQKIGADDEHGGRDIGIQFRWQRQNTTQGSSLKKAFDHKSFDYSMAAEFCHNVAQAAALARFSKTSSTPRRCPPPAAETWPTQRLAWPSGMPLASRQARRSL